MSRIINSGSQENLQTEIAILQKKILAFKPCYAKLKIPALMDENDYEMLEVPMPVHLAITYGNKIIPKGTKLLVQTVAGNYNEIKIIGYYDNPKQFNFISFINRFFGENAESPLPDDYGIFPYDEIE